MSSIAEKLQRLATYKSDIKDAIIGKGVECGEDMSKYAEAIGKISGGGEPLPIPTDIPAEDDLTLIKLDAGEGSVTIINCAMDGKKVMQYSKNGEGWRTVIYNVPIVVVQGDRIKLKSESEDVTSIFNYRQYYQIATDGLFACGGCLDSLYARPSSFSKSYQCAGLFCGANIVNTPHVLCTSITGSNAMRELYKNCNRLEQAADWRATTLGSYCLYEAYMGCTSLRRAPKLPAITLAANCYTAMFVGCTSLIEAPELPAEQLADSSYSYMFSGCSSLREIKAMCRITHTGAAITTSLATRWLQGTNLERFFKNPEWAGPTQRTTNTIPASVTIVNWIE